MDTGTLNFIWSRTLIAGLLSAGVSHAVVSPGSRSTPLTLALLRQPGFGVEVAVDERSAAFFALGLAKASGKPVVLVATSGTAPANWLPAVIEANHGNVPLILISADRPPELQGVGANQTVNQIDLFASHVRASHALGTPSIGFDAAYLHRLALRVVEQACWPHPGPVHINQPFHEPLIPSGEVPAPLPVATLRTATPMLAPDPTMIAELARALSGRPGMIICGELPKKNGLDAVLTALAERLDCPILAEPLSNLRFARSISPRLCVRYNHWLGDAGFADQHRPDWVLRLGAWPVTRHLQNYAATAPIQALIEPTPRWSDPAHRLTHLLRADPLAACTALLAALPAASPNAICRALLDRDRIVPDAGDAWPVPALLSCLPDEMAVFVGNSLSIRQLDTYAGTGEKTLYFYGNRGASGIDGNISTALGIAAEHGRIVALIGDLTAQHDLGGLALAAGRNAVFVVINNGGGGIFEHLPQAALPEFETGWRTPQRIDFKHAAASFGLDHVEVNTPASLTHAVSNAIRHGGAHLIECIVSPRNHLPRPQAHPN